MLMHEVESYLAVRRAAGFALRRTERHLRSFARFAIDHGENHVRAQTALQWAALSPSPCQPHYRLRSVINLARYLRAEDDRHELPPDDVFVHRHRRPRPFIFSPGEIESLVAHAARLGPTGSLRPHTYSTLFALLATTGLRISEALKLRLTDLTPDGLIIRETKFRKNRLVPLHETACAAMDRYLVYRRAVRGPDDHLFVSARGKKLSYAIVYVTFKQLLRAIALNPRPGAGSPPRIHSLRHTFAVRALESCRGDRHQIARHVLALSTYLGHVGIASSYWYLEVTPQLLADTSMASETFFYRRDL